LRIQKYPNRRLYDRTGSRHLTAEQLHNLVAEGHRVQVSDSRTGEDITNVVLAQLLLERDPLKLTAFPPEFFHLLIRAGQRAIPSFQRAIAETTMGLARGWTEWRAWSEPMAALLSAGNPAAPAGLGSPMQVLFPWLASPRGENAAPDRAHAEPPDAGDDLADATQRTQRSVPPTPPRARRSDPSGTADLKRRLRDLRKELASLERLSAEVAPPPRASEHKSGNGAPGVEAVAKTPNRRRASGRR